MTFKKDHIYDSNNGHIVLCTEEDGQNPLEDFSGVVLLSNDNKYKIGFKSDRWNKSWENWKDLGELKEDNNEIGTSN